VTVKHGKWEAEVDVKLAPLILELWKAEIWTLQSCQNHSMAHKVWLHFLTAETAEQFLSVAADPEHTPDLWCRAGARYFGGCGRTSTILTPHDGPRIEERDAWEYHVGIAEHALSGAEQSALLIIEISVLFPRRDLKVILARIQEYNALNSLREKKRRRT
jgi:hypothetical protein